MHKRKLGKHGFEMGALGLGCMGMSEFYGPANEEESIATIHLAIDLGVTHFDTADVYGPHTNEVLVGRALVGHRDRVTIATKFGNVRDAAGAWKGISGKPSYVRECCEASLRRLDIETIDLYYQHRVDTDTPIEETVGAMAALVKEGKVRYLGLSEAGANTIRRACAVHPITALQTEYSLWTRDPEDGILTACRELGVGFVAYSPLGRGFLSGRIKSHDDLDPTDYRRMAPRLQSENMAKNLELVARVEAIAAAKGCTPSQLALAWVLAQGNDVVAIPGTKRRTYLRDNVAAAEIQLTADELQQLDAAAPKGATAGLRYPEAGMRRVGI
jgi:aryl-alcohol dehydrogenase-like predicted oxidoreductase